MTLIKAQKKIKAMRGNEGKCTRVEKMEQGNSQNIVQGKQSSPII
jgi:hypothetical protein